MEDFASNAGRYIGILQVGIHSAPSLVTNGIPIIYFFMLSSLLQKLVLDAIYLTWSMITSKGRNSLLKSASIFSVYLDSVSCVGDQTSSVSPSLGIVGGLDS